MFVSFLLTPYIVHKLGVQRYGLWAFVSSAVGFAALLQFGVGKGSVRFIAFYSEQGEFEVVRRIVSYSAASHIVAGILLSPFAWLAGRALLPHLNIPPDLVHTGEVLFPLVFAYFFLAGAVRPLGLLLVGLERMWMMSVSTLLSQFGYAVTVVVLLRAGAGLYGLVVATGFQALLQAVAFYLSGKKLIGRVFGNPFRLDRGLLKEMLRFGGWIQVNSLANLVNRQTDAIVIGSWVNVSNVAFYDVGNRIAQLVRTLPLALLGPLLPATAGIHAQGDEARLARTVLQSNRLLGLLTVGMAGYVLAAAPLIMTVWLGHGYPHVVVITVVMVVTYTLNNLTGVGTTVVSAIGRPRYESEYAVVGMLLNVAATLALAPFFGLYGIVGGTAVGVGLCSVYFLWRFHRLMHYSMWDYVGSWLWRLVAATAIAGFSTAVLRMALPGDVSERRLAGLFALGALGFVYCCVLLAALRVLRFLQARDLVTLGRVLPTRLRPLARLPVVEFLFGARS
jgi:O-antigen/teichoic acid export membrane protein